MASSPKNITIFYMKKGTQNLQYLQLQLNPIYPLPPPSINIQSSPFHVSSIHHLPRTRQLIGTSDLGNRSKPEKNSKEALSPSGFRPHLALTPAIQIHRLLQRFVRLPPLLVSVPCAEKDAEIGAGGEGPESGGGEAILPLLKGSESGIPLESLIGVTLHHRHGRRHPDPAQVTHLLVFRRVRQIPARCRQIAR